MVCHSHRSSDGDLDLDLRRRRGVAESTIKANAESRYISHHHRQPATGMARRAFGSQISTDSSAKLNPAGGYGMACATAWVPLFLTGSLNVDESAGGPIGATERTEVSLRGFWSVESKLEPPATPRPSFSLLHTVFALSSLVSYFESSDCAWLDLLQSDSFGSLVCLHCAALFLSTLFVVGVSMGVQ